MNFDKKIDLTAGLECIFKIYNIKTNYKTEITGKTHLIRLSCVARSTRATNKVVE